MAELERRATLVSVLESENNTASVPAVISTMQAMYTLIEEIHLAVDRTQELEVNAKPLQPGSLEIFIEFASMTTALLQGQGLVDWILIIARQFFDLKKLLGGDKYVISGDNNIVYGDGSTVNVHTPTTVLMSPSNAANKQLQAAFRNVSADPRIEGFRVERAETGSSLIDLPRGEFQAFNIPKGIVDESPSREFVREKARLRIRSSAFDETLRWRFVHDGKLMSAVLADDTFLQRVMSGERFASGDTLVADVLVRQRWDILSNGFVDDEHEIIRVHEHIARDDPRGQLSFADNLG